MVASADRIWSLLEAVSDPEVPVLSVIDLGIVRGVVWQADEEQWLIQITPTYSGCPAMDTLSADITMQLRTAGIPHRVELVLSPAWTTDWMSENGKRKLMEYGIHPPTDPTADKRALQGERGVIKCPNCGSHETEMVSAFGSTACKALFKCLDCLEPFDYFKCLR